jgi:hypothetical protein
MFSVCGTVKLPVEVEILTFDPTVALGIIESVHDTNRERQEA